MTPIDGEELSLRTDPMRTGDKNREPLAPPIWGGDLELAALLDDKSRLLPETK